MKNPLLFGALALLTFSCATTEKTLTLQSGPTDGSSIFVAHNDHEPTWAEGNVYENQNVTQELPVSVTYNGYDLIRNRSYVAFDLSSLPVNAKIVSAKLSLYGMASPPATIPYGFAKENSILVQRVTGNWNEKEMTWNTQPTIAEKGQLVFVDTVAATPDVVNEEDEVTSIMTVEGVKEESEIRIEDPIILGVIADDSGGDPVRMAGPNADPYKIAPNYNVIELDVTDMVKAMRAESPDKTAGFRLKLKEELPSRAVVFWSNRAKDKTKRPKLVIVYRD